MTLSVFHLITNCDYATHRKHRQARVITELQQELLSVQCERFLAFPHECSAYFFLIEESGTALLLFAHSHSHIIDVLLQYAFSPSSNI